MNPRRPRLSTNKRRQPSCISRRHRRQSSTNKRLRWSSHHHQRSCMNQHPRRQSSINQRRRQSSRHRQALISFFLFIFTEQPITSTLKERTLQDDKEASKNEPNRKRKQI